MDSSKSAVRIEKDSSKSAVRIDKDNSKSAVRIDKDNSKLAVRIDMDNSKSAVRINKDSSKSAVRIDKDKQESDLLYSICSMAVTTRYKTEALSFKMSDLRRKRHTIPLNTDDCIWYVKNVTRYTTCRQIVKMMLKNITSGKGHNSDCYGIYESSQGIDRLLPDKTRILKVMRSWNAENFYEFVLRKNEIFFEASALSKARRKKLFGRNGLPFANLSRQGDYYKKSVDTSFYQPMKMDSYIEGCDCKESINDDIIDFNVGKSDFNDAIRNRWLGQSENVKAQESNSSKTFAINTATDVKHAARKQLKTKAYQTIENSPNACFGTKTDSDDILTERNLPAERCRTPRRTQLRRHQQLASQIETKIARFSEKEDKNALLEKYFMDYMTYCSPNQVVDSVFRKRGDGAESGSETNCFTSHYWNTNTPNFSKKVCDVNDENKMDYIRDDKFSKAFVVNETHTNFVDKLVDYSLTDDEGNTLADTREINTASELN